MKKLAAIFDMDGTLIDNNAYHFLAYQQLFKTHRLPELSQQTFNEQLSGVPGLTGLHHLLDGRFKEDEVKAMFEEKNENYKKVYAPYIKPINGLERFLAELKDAGVKMAVATSASHGNVDFVFGHLNIRQYFDAIVDNTGLTHGKPDPEIFLKAAAQLNMEPANCVVFEDSISGVKAANSAGMKVVAITTTHKAGELKPVNLLINDYADIDINKLTALFDDKDE
ncbi:HAD family hydrolase [Mucilaginibacter agri]|uniref:Beta-phosphoglucomutase n=1 Tax=Mucilaginibacter agri TaxID=2695265 RepID=A0A965ZI93_9SPHI|nr:HAD family phosphatase [Mucilaginibacter agri]NCD71535.1 beta-phosphoglucomutase family hydrolase [Mucilaginibacter agri]